MSGAVSQRPGTAGWVAAWAASAAWAAMVPASPAWACPLAAGQAGEQQIVQGPVQLTWRAEPAELAVGRPFVLMLQVCPAQAQVLRIDATMPEHRHGMNYRPSVKALGDGRWRAEGLLWHMAGRWELAVEVESNGERRWLRQPVMLR